MLTTDRARLTRLLLSLFACCATFIAALPAMGQAVRYVDAAAPANGDGTSWSSAYQYLYNALEEANQGTGSFEIRVAAGVYYPDDDNPYLNNLTFNIERDGIQLLGGYPANSFQSGGGSRDVETNLTILSGDLDQDDVDPDGDGIIESPDDIRGENSSILALDRTFSPDPFTTATVVDGFVFTAGYGGRDNRGGAGLLLEQGADDFDDTPVLRNLTFVGNTAFAGAGLSVVTVGSSGTGRAAPTISNVAFRNNSVYRDLEQYNGPGRGGAAAFIGRVDVSLSGATFENNFAIRQGGAVFAEPDFSGDTLSVTLRDVVFRDNYATGGGGAVFFSANLSGAEGTFLIDRAVFEGNGIGGLSKGLGGVGGSGDITIANATFAGNAGGIEFESSNPDDLLRIINTTFADNTWRLGGLPHLRLLSDTEVYNTVLWSSDGGTRQLAAFDGDVKIRNSVIRNGCEAQLVWSPATIDCGDDSTILDADPLLIRLPDPGADGFGDDPETEADESIDDDYGDLRPAMGSLLIESGANAHLQLGGNVFPEFETDLNGAPRIFGGYVDIGAYEYSSTVSNTTPAEIAGQTGFFGLGDTRGMIFISENTSTDGSLDAIQSDELPGGTGLPGDVANFTLALNSTLNGAVTYNLTLDVSDYLVIEPFSALSIYATEDDDLTNATWLPVPEESMVRDSLRQRISAVGQNRFAAFTVGGPDGTLTVGLDATEPVLPLRLHAPFPNPARSTVTLAYELDHPSHVRLEIFDVQGRRVEVVRAGVSPAGHHRVAFDAGELAAGLYFCRIRADNATATVPLVIR